MPRRKRSTDTPPTPPPNGEEGNPTREPLPGMPEAAQPRDDAGGTVQPRLSLPLTSDGRIDLGSLRNATRERLRTALGDPELPAGLGLISPEAPGAPIEVFTAQDAGGLYDILGQLELWAAIRLLKWPAELAVHIVPYSDQEKGLLGEPTAKVLNKHLPAALGKWKEELGLALALVSVHQAKYNRMARLMEQRAQQAEEIRRRQEEERLQQEAGKVDGAGVGPSPSWQEPVV